MGKKKAPEYATTNYDTGGLFGSSTTSKSGTTYTPTSWMSDTMGTVGGNVNSTLNNMLSNDFANDPNFQAYQNQLNKTAQQSYDASVLSPLANRGLMRSSGLQAATNAFADTLADQTTNLYDSYYNRQANNLSNLLNTSNTLYNYLTGINTGSQNLANNVSNYNMQAYQAQQAANNALWSGLMNAGAGLGGSLGGAAILASDERVKENIKKNGEKNGFNWYEFNYKDGYGLPKGRQEGVIAQEVEKIKPEAVTEIDGIKHVNYSMLGIKKEV